MNINLKNIGLAALTMIVLGGVLVCFAAAPASAHPTVDIAVANWKFTPNTITIPAGEPTTLRLTSASGVHGIKSDDLGIPMTTIPNGKTVEVTFTPTKPGTYVLHCQVFCGTGHADMALTIVVTGS